MKKKIIYCVVYQQWGSVLLKWSDVEEEEQKPAPNRSNYVILASPVKSVFDEEMPRNKKMLVAAGITIRVDKIQPNQWYKKDLNKAN